MTVPTTESVESAIAAGMAAEDSDAVMRAVAGSQVVVPQAADATTSELDNESISLPVIEQDGTSYVPVFTSTRALNEAAPDVEDTVTVSAVDLASSWPSEDLWLAVNPGTEDGLTLPPDAVRSLPGYAEAPPA